MQVHNLENKLRILFKEKFALEIFWLYDRFNLYRRRQNIRGGKLSRFINNMHYVGKTFAVCRLKLRARLCNVDFRVCAN